MYIRPERFRDEAEYLRKLRSQLHAHGISYRKFALFADVTPQHLSRWFAGGRKPTLESMTKLDDALTRMLYGG